MLCLHHPSVTRASLFPAGGTPLKKSCEFTIYDLSIGDLASPLQRSVSWRGKMHFDHAIGGLAIRCLGVHAIESLGVDVATNVVRMMKRKFATSRFSNLGSAIPGLLAKLHRMVFDSFSRSPE